MSDTLTSLADVVKINDRLVKDAGATEIFNDAPLLMALMAVKASHGTQHKYLRETGAPTVGFRAANAGRAWTTDADTLVTVDLKIVDASYGVDQSLADSYPQGRDAFMERKGLRSLRASLQLCEKQFLYGTGNDSGGFVGLAQAMNDTADGQVLDAGGSTACTSVWMIRSVGDESGVCVVVGNDGEVRVEPYTSQDQLDGSSNHFPIYYQPIKGWMGLTLGSKYCAVRIANVGTNAGKGLTDALLSSAYELFPEGLEPTHIVCNRRSVAQLQRSRTATSPTGAPAPFPVEWNGIPIIQTRSIGNGETALTSTPVSNASGTSF